MAKFRKRPVVIEARQFDGSPESANDICRWANNNQPEMDDPNIDYVLRKNEVSDMQCATLEGFMHVSVGDWIIQGVNGEFYPCKPDIFEQTYDPVD